MKRTALFALVIFSFTPIFAFAAGTWKLQSSYVSSSGCANETNCNVGSVCPTIGATCENYSAKPGICYPDYAGGYCEENCFIRSYSCVAAGPVCSTTDAHACTTGTVSNQSQDADSWDWSCTSGGTTINCSRGFAACAATHYGCTDGTLLSTAEGAYQAPRQDSAAYYWTCKKWGYSTTNPATNTYSYTNCSEQKPGEGYIVITDYVTRAEQNCSPYPMCIAPGTSCDPTYTNETECIRNKCTSVYPPQLWIIDAYACATDGVCGTSLYGCAKGTSINNVDAGSSWTWGCAGNIWGRTDGCSLPKPKVDGLCGGTTYSCNAGTSVNNVNGPSARTWSCNGLYGGTNDSCATPKASCILPTVGGTISSGSSTPYFATAAVACGSSCTSQSRYCDDGTLSGSYIIPSCTQSPLNGSCTATHYSCNTGTSASNVSGATSYTWTCAGGCGGSSASCSESKCTANYGQTCTSAANTCGQTASGTYLCNGTCSAAAPGTTTCPPAAPVIGGPTTTDTESSPNYTFTGSSPAGVTVRYAIDWDNDGVVNQYSAYGASGWTFTQANGWSGPGMKTFKAYVEASNGKSSGWTTYNVDVKQNGKCNSPQTHYGCLQGTSVSNVSGAMKWTWLCNGINGGTNASCEETKPAPSVPTITGPSTGATSTNAIFTLKSTNASGDNIRYALEWTGDDTPEAYAPGTYVAPNTAQTWQNNWSGPGVKTFRARAETNGGPKSAWSPYFSIRIYGSPVVSWNPTSKTLDYGTTLTFGYTSSEATSCSVWNVADGVEILIGNPTAYTWTDQGPYTADFKRRVRCENPYGNTTVELVVTVNQNGVECSSITADPVYVVPGKTFTGVITLKNIGTNPWRNGTIPHYVYDAVNQNRWGATTVSLDTEPIAQGILGTFTETFKAPLTPGNYPFTWGLRQRLDATTAINIGGTCELTNGVAGQIVVKPPTLTVSPTPRLSFPATVIGDSPSDSILPLTIGNSGGGTLTGTIEGITTVSSPFYCDGTCDFTVSAGKTIQKTLKFKPTALVTPPQNITVRAAATADSAEQSVNVELNGSALDKFLLVPTAANFGQVAETRSKYVTLTVTNRALHLVGTTTAISLNPPFYCVEGCEAATLAPGAKRTMKLRFSSTTPGIPVSASIPVTTDPVTQLMLSGESVKAEFIIKEQ